MDSEVVGLGRYLSAIRRRGWIVLVAVVVFAVAVAGYIAARPNQYAATAQVLIKPYSTAKFTEPVFTTAQVDTQVAVMQSLAVVAPVVTKLHLPESPATLQKSISAAPVSDTSIIAVTVSRPNPTEAARIANALAESYLNFRSSGLPAKATGSFAVIVGHAQPPDHPAGTSPVFGGVAGALLGLILGCAAALIASRRDPSLPDEAAVAAATTGMPMLGRIPRAKSKSGRPALLERPTSRESLAYRFLTSSIRALGPDRPGRSGTATAAPKIVLIVSAGPREGRTSVAANVALAAADAGQRVLLCDADLTKPGLTELLGEGSDVTLERLLRRDVPVDLGLLARPVPHLYLLGAEETATSQASLLGNGRFHDLIASFAGLVSLVVVDTSPLLSSADMLELVPQADVVLFVVRERVSTESDIASASELVRQVGGTVDGIVLTGSSSSMGAQRSTRRRASSPKARTSPSEPAEAGSSSPPTQVSKR
ncbi:MAG: hypothetical protein QOI06_973 [Nocardioidaceae bacterium]|nr:hypothetical protein [Nocardioidaceae bacterium]